MQRGMVTSQYETLRNMVLTSAIRNQEFMLFIDYGMVGWLETISECFIFSLPKEEEQPLSVNYISSSLQSQAVNILTDMIFYCLETATN
jgi:hypothetical protein